MIRFGSRLGPNAVRHASTLTGKLLRDAVPSPLESKKVIDAGNVELSLEDIGSAFGAIESAVKSILAGGCKPLTVGGDGAVSLPVMRALRATHGEFALIHVDAHTDAWPVDPESPYTNANQFTHAARENLLDISHALHLGTRGPVNADWAIGHTRDLGYEVIPFEEYRDRGLDRILARIRDRIGTRPVFICYDMDFFDPSVAPGVATPTPGGAFPEEGISLMRGLAGLNIVAIDINTMTPVHDQDGTTAGLAATLVAEGLACL